MARSATTSAATDKHVEQQLLLGCARNTSDPALTRQMRPLLQTELDWDYVFQMALQHRIMPLLYRNLNASGPDAVPPAMLNLLRQHFFINAQRNLFLAAELLKILQLFETHGIPAVPYKGATLAVSAYGNLALRQFGDLDILLHKEDIPQASDLLCSLGYQSHSHPNYAYEFTRDDGQTIVELHWEAVGFASPWQNTSRYCSFPLDLNHMRERLAAVPLAGTTAHSLSPEDLLQILCVHGSKHRWERLIWICDVAHLIRAQPIDWPRVLEQSRQLGSERMLRLGLCLAHDLLGADLPEHLRRSIQADTGVKKLAAQVSQRLFDTTGNMVSAVEELAFSLRMRECWKDRILFLLHYLHIYLRSVMTATANERSLRPPLVNSTFLQLFQRPARLRATQRLRLPRYLTRKE